MRRLACLALILLLAVSSAVEAKKKKKGKDPEAAETSSSLNAATFAGLKLRGIGPALMSGRIADIAIHPERPATWYVAVGSGGVWKTTNAGTTFESIFDGQGSYSVGCVTIDPSNPETIWVGSGENVSGRHVGYGNGVYRSRDAGATWENVGLETSEHISKIIVDPRASSIVWVAAEGPLWSAGGERGLYKTTDGGETWTESLVIDENTGITDLEFDPRNPNVMYAAAYERRRTVWALLAGGPGSGIYKTTDGGENWRQITRGIPGGDKGKIAIAVSPVDPDYVYATIEADARGRGFYRSTDAGESFEKRNRYISGGTGPHYYQEIYASPHDRDRVYQMDVWMRVTDDGGKNFSPVGEQHKHSDNHALAFHPAHPEYLLAGSDGGLYESWDLGKTWRFMPNLPVTQFYKMALDNDEPFYNVVGGTQDNGTQSGPSRTRNVHGIRNSDWYVPLGADGHGCQVDPENPDILYVEWQVGNLRRHDRRTGENVDIRPQPAPGDDPERYNWDAPILISPHAPNRLYFGSQRLWRSDDRGNSWTTISGDLSHGVNRYEKPIDGRVRSVNALYDNGAMSWYGNTTAISESPLVEGLIYVGTDDGRIQVTEDGGTHWRAADSFPGVPERPYVNEVKASLHDADTVFAVMDQHKTGDYGPFVLKSTDRGKTWTSIAGDLPERHIVWSIVQDHVRKELMFAGTEFGIFFTLDGGDRWVRLSGNAPTISFRDLEIQQRENDLVGASFGRGFWILDDYTPLRHITAEALEQEALLFPVKKTLLYEPSTPLAVGGQGYQGASMYVAPNPPFGAIFTYRLKESLTTPQEERRKEEKKLAEEDADVPFPGFDELEDERRAAAPRIVLTVRDGDGNVVRRLEGPKSAGIHRVAWDLHEPPRQPINLSPRGDLPPWASAPVGPWVVPGRYSVELAKFDDGAWSQLGEPQSFDVVALDDATFPRPDAATTVAFQREAADLQRRVLGAGRELSRAADRLDHLERAVLETPAADSEWLVEIRALQDTVADLRAELGSPPVLRRMDEPTSPGLRARVGNAVNGSGLAGPTQTHRESLAIAKADYGPFAERLRRLIERDLVDLETRLEAAGAPWTPGRAVPGAP